MQIIINSIGEYPSTCELSGCKAIIDDSWVEYEGRRFCDDPHKLTYQRQLMRRDIQRLEDRGTITVQEGGRFECA
jgi:hypothetical protein